MNNNETTILLLVGGAILLIGLLFMLSPRTEADSPAMPPPVSPAPIAEPLPTPSVPVVNAGHDRVVLERETIRLAGSASSPSGAPLTYAWTANGALGVFENAHSPTTAYTAPSSCTCETRVVLTLTARSAEGYEASDQMVITVRNPLACPPPVPSPVECTPPADPCTVDRETATCPASPNVACDTPCITMAPEDPGCPPPVPCPCADAGDCTSVWQTAWPTDAPPLHPRDHAKPAIDRHYPAEIDEGTSVLLRARVHNPACRTVCYVWSVSKGHLENADTLTPTFHAPLSDRRDGETATITLTVYDASGGHSFDQIRIVIRNTDPR